VVDVIADHRLGNGNPHVGRRLCDGVGSEVDQCVVSLQFTVVSSQFTVDSRQFTVHRCQSPQPLSYRPEPRSLLNAHCPTLTAQR
jgi:hypothetical protein